MMWRAVAFVSQKWNGTGSETHFLQGMTPPDSRSLSIASEAVRT
jgi:hypothetical protein